jgi:hypothetical protein
VTADPFPRHAQARGPDYSSASSNVSKVFVRLGGLGGLDCGGGGGLDCGGLDSGGGGLDCGGGGLDSGGADGGNGGADVTGMLAGRSSAPTGGGFSVLEPDVCVEVGATS